jgi:hypothetical protein
VCAAFSCIKNKKMKNSISILFLLLLSTIGFSQTSSYGVFIPGMTTTASIFNNRMEQAELKAWVRGTYRRKVVKETVINALLLSDIAEGYATSWIKHYISTEITTTSNSKVLKAVGVNNTLSVAQKGLLKKSDLNAEIYVHVKYKISNIITGGMDEREVNFSITIIPQVEAEFTKGDVNQFLAKDTKKRLAQVTAEKFKEGLVRFVINEEGDVENVKIITTTGDSKIDKLLLQVINQMPKWNCAKDAKGVKVKQAFEFLVGYMVGGC